MANAEYCEIPSEDSIFSQPLETDIFVKISAEKYVKVAHKGEHFSDDRRTRYVNKGIQSFYIQKQDFRKIVNFNLTISQAMAKSDAVPLEKKRKFLTQAGEIIVQNTFVSGLDHGSFKDSKTFLESSLEILTEDIEIFSLLESLNKHSDSLYTHSLAVSMYSVMIAKAIGWSSSANLFKLSFGGLMHDIGKKDFSPELLKKPKSELSFTEKAQLETHPQKSRDILEALKSVPTEAVMIAYQHHEHRAEGYPQKLKGRQIHPMAKIVTVANEFCGYAIGSATVKDMTAGKAIHMMEQYKKDQLDPEFFSVLKALANIAA